MVSVVMLPTFVGSMKGVLSITRIGKESERREKNVVCILEVYSNQQDF